MHQPAAWRRGLLALAGVFAVGVVSIHAQETTDPPMNPAVFEDVPAPDSPEGRAASGTIAVVTLQTPSAAEIDAGVLAPAAPDPAAGIRFEDLAHAIGVRVRVLTRGQHVQRGVVAAADARHLTLTVKRHGGSASYVLSREQVQRVDPD